MNTTMKRIVAITVVVVVSFVRCEDVIVSTTVGDIRGFKQDFTLAGQPYTASAFLGIPYAETTEGSRRFTKPVEKAPFDGVYNATEVKPACFQNLQWAPGLDINTSEDCLTLNIFAPNNAKKGDSKAVMIFLYGGGFQFGIQDSYITGSLPALYDVIYVTLSYRLSAYGFLASKKHGLKGNYGLWDQHMGIKWIHDNIDSFGGDPNAITIFGESAGAVSVIYQTLYEGNRGLFKRAVAQSGVAGAFWAYNTYPDMLYEKLAKTTDCDTTSDSADCLRNLSDKEMQDAFKASSFGDMYLPVRDDEFIKYDPENFMKDMTKDSTDALSYFAEKDVIIGLNSDEGYGESMFFMFIFGEDLSQLNDGLTEEEMGKLTRHVLKYNNQSFNEPILNALMHQYTDWSNPKSPVARRASYLDFVKDVQYTISSVKMLNKHASSEYGQTFMYHFEHKPSFSHSPDWIFGANHADEIPFALGFPGNLMMNFGIFAEDAAKEVPANEQVLSMKIMKYWTQFAKTGNPNDPAEVSTQQWPQYEAVNQTYIRFIADVEQFPTGNIFRSEYVNFWEKLYPDIVNITTQQAKDTSHCGVNAASAFNWTLSSILSYISILILFF